MRALPWPVAALALAGLAEAATWWPGAITWDGAREYGQALSGWIDDWHPPVMIALWRALLHVARGPATMLSVQLGLYFGGFAMVAGAAWRRGRRALGWALATAALFPIPLAIESAVMKDALMAGALLVAAALVADGRRPARGIAGALLLFAATLRFNGFLACIPFAVMLVPQRWREGPWRLGASVLASAALLLAATPITNRLIGAHSSGVALSQMMFDLGGITYFSGADAFPPLPDIDDPVAINAHCYSPELWDSYAWWVDEPCDIDFEGVRDALRGQRANPYAWWIAAVARHPIAYGEHRLSHFNRNARLWVPGGPVLVVPDGPEPNPWGYEPRRDAPGRAIVRAATALARTPLGWPAWWMALALGVLMLGPALPSRRLAASMAGSALLYGAGYVVLSVASDLRYHLWTMLAALIAVLAAADDLRSGARPGRGRLALAALPAVVVTLVCTAARLGLAG